MTEDRAREVLAEALDGLGQPQMASAIRAGASRDAVDQAAIVAIRAAAAEAVKAERERAARVAEREKDGWLDIAKLAKFDRDGPRVRQCEDRAAVALTIATAIREARDEDHR